MIGIPMGSDLAALMENRFLYYYENKCILKAKKFDLKTARLFRNTFGFIDELKNGKQN